jgi:hypothetical protein
MSGLVSRMHWRGANGPVDGRASYPMVQDACSSRNAI